MDMSRIISLRAVASIVVCSAAAVATGCASQSAPPPVAGATPSQAVTGSRLSAPSSGAPATQVYNNDIDPLGGVLDTPFVNVNPGMSTAGNKVNR
jgi:hypothetical protein